MRYVRVPAKINLHLQVAGRRADGFHELRTLFQSVGVWDVVCGEVATSPLLELEVSPSQSVTAGQENLVLKAGDALRRFAGRSCGARLKLVKRIPVGGGMGGGSADAAAALVLLNDLWQLGLRRRELHQVATSLGSDVPFFLCGGFALGTGRGEEVWPLVDIDPLEVVLVFPAIEVSTAEVFGSLNRGADWATMTETVYSGLVASPLRIEWGAMVNDLQAPVCARWPEVATILRLFEEGRCVHAAMTGSGSCVFAMFRDGDAARREADVIGRSHDVKLISTLTREQSLLKVETTDLRQSGKWPAI